MYETINLPIPAFACGETHDTPRLAAREGGKILSKTLTVLNMFTPNGVPFINSGQEIFETQPMNTGLDCKPDEQFNLEVDDPYYGKLALFDKYQLHYTNPRRWELPDMLDQIKPIRKKYLKQLTNKKSFLPLFAPDQPKTFIGLAYFSKKTSNKENCLLILANANPYHEQFIRPNIHDLRALSNNKEIEGKLLFSTHEGPREFTQFIDYDQLDIHLGPGEVKIIEL